MSRTINRPSTNITPPTAPHPAAAHLGVKVARAVTRCVRQLIDCLAEPVAARKFGHRDYLVLELAGLVERVGTWRQDVALTDAGRDLAESL